MNMQLNERVNERRLRPVFRLKPAHHRLRLALVVMSLAYAMPAIAPASMGALLETGAAQAASEDGGANEGVSLESAANKAGETGRKVAMSLIGLAFAFAAVVLAFKRDFRDAVGVFFVGVVAVLLASPTGIGLMKSTVESLFG